MKTIGQMLREKEAEEPKSSNLISTMEALRFEKRWAFEKRLGK